MSRLAKAARDFASARVAFENARPSISPETAAALDAAQNEFLAAVDDDARSTAWLVVQAQHGDESAQSVLGSLLRRMSRRH